MSATPSRSSKLTISFGLVNVPISMKPLVELQKPVSGKLTCPEHGPGLKQQYICSPGEKHEHVATEIVKSYPHPDDPSRMVVLDPSVVDEFAEQKTGAARIEHMVDASLIDPVYLDKAYLVWPGDGGDAGFDLIVAYLRSEGKAAVTTTVIGKRTRIVVFRWSEEFGCLVGHMVRFSSELRNSDVALVQSGASARTEVDPQQYELAKTILDQLDSDFDPTEVSDTYTALMQHAIKQAADGQEFTPPEVTGASSAEDLLGALMSSIEDSGAKPKAKAKSKAPARKRAAAK